MNLNEKYWLYFEPYVYIDVKKDSFLLYNTLDGAFIINDDTVLLKLMKGIVNPVNCGVIPLVFTKNNQAKFHEFVNDIRNKFMGDIIRQKLSTGRPIQPLSLPHLKENPESYGLKDSFIGTDLIKFLSKISVYLSSTCQHHCRYCCSLYKQFPCCTKFRDEFDMDLLEKMIVDLVEADFKGHINFFMGDSSQDINRLAKILQPYNGPFSLYYHAKSIEDIFGERVNIAKENIKIIVDYDSISNQLLSQLEEKGLKNIIAIISNSKEYLSFTRMFSKEKGFNMKIEPFFTGENIEFFKQNVFLEKDDILQGAKNLQYIHQNTILNRNFFGEIEIIPNGKVYANMNDKQPVGNLKDDTIAKIVYNAMFSKNSSWMKTRQLKMCKKCIFQHLCPPVSNYEFALNNQPLCFKNN